MVTVAAHGLMLWYGRRGPCQDPRVRLRPVGSQWPCENSRGPKNSPILRELEKDEEYNAGPWVMALQEASSEVQPLPSRTSCGRRRVMVVPL